MQKVDRKQAKERLQRIKEKQDEETKLSRQKHEEEFRKTIPKRMLQLILRATKHDIGFSLIEESENIKIVFHFEYEDKEIDFNSIEWTVQSLEEDFYLKDIELAERERKRVLRCQAIEKVKATFSEEEIKLLGISLC